MRKAGALLLVCMLILVSSIVCLAEDRTFSASLSGKNEVPKAKSPARGDLKLRVSEDGVSFELNVENLTSPTAANIHRGRKGENGPPVAGLFGGPTRNGKIRGILAEGMLTEQSLLGELQGKSVADLIALIKSGNAYVNILTETYPAGEIRGQIK
jgi:hypothetical protein